MTADDQEFHFSPRPNRAAEVGWRPWGPAAFAEAQEADRPILLSISAVWCHWCHVMDERTYSDQGVIDLIRKEYVPVRVDNDVRPDINQRYNMGGWPTTAFLTPGGDILTGATYLPPEQMRDALERISAFYRERKHDIEARLDEVRQATVPQPRPASLDGRLVERIVGGVEGAYDPVHGGFGQAPKFPHPEALALLLEQAALRQEPRLAQMARRSLEAMAEGGMYDQVEGGFFRYSTTADFSVPHFEKMLEDHALLISGLAQAGLDDVLDRTTAYVERVLRDPATGLYAGSQDADEAYYALDAPSREGSSVPPVDRRVYTGWNCALAVAYLEADRRLARPQLKASAERALTRLFEERWQPGVGLAHSESVTGQLGDQVWGLLAAIRAASAGLRGNWLSLALALADVLKDRFADSQGGFFDSTPAEPLGRLAERLKPLPDNAVAALALLELDVLAGSDGQYRAQSEATLAAVAPHGDWLLAAGYARALDRYLRPPIKVGTGDELLIRSALTAYPYCVIEWNGRRDAVVCIGTKCLLPAENEEELRSQLMTQMEAIA